MGANVSKSGDLALISPSSARDLEAEVMRLREQCRKIITELERRFDRVARLPRKVSDARRRLVGLVRAYPLWSLAAVALVVAGLVATRRR